MEMSVMTYGGGVAIKNVFTMIAHFMGDGAVIRPLVIVSASIGAVWGISQALFSTSMEAVLGKFFLPFVVAAGAFMIPTTDVHIEDILTEKIEKVSNVPFFLGKTVGLVSTVGYSVTKVFEKAGRGVRDNRIDKTGMIFGSESALEMSEYKITNANLEGNLQRFAKNCVLYDIALGRYTINDFKKSKDLMKLFLGSNSETMSNKGGTSKVRSILYCPIDEEDKGNSLSDGQCDICSCHNAISRMEKYLRKEENYYTKNEIYKNLPVAFQALKGLKRESSDQLGQLLLVNSFKNSFKPKREMAIARAKEQQKSTYHILGSLAAKNLIPMRAVLEALTYGAFIFVMPLILFPGGFLYFANWVKLIAWIQLWPPFYVILDCIMRSYALNGVDTLVGGLSPSEQGLSIFTSFGLINIQDDFYAMAGYLSASIPFLSYILLQGSISGFTHLAGSLMSPAHSAASMASAEEVTGNYSYGNISLNNTSFANSGVMNKNLSPSLSMGYQSHNMGDASVVQTDSGRMFIRQESSQLNTSLMQGNTLNEVLERGYQNAVSQNQADSLSYTESASHTARDAYNFSQHLASDHNFSDSLSQREGYDTSESARYMQNTIANFSKQHGISEKESADVLLGGSYVGVGGNFAIGTHKDEVYQAAQNISKSEEFQGHSQKILSVAQNESSNVSDSEGNRMAKDLSTSYDKMQSSQKNFTNSYSVMEQAQSRLNTASSWSQSVQENLNQQMVDWASDNFGGDVVTRAIRQNNTEILSAWYGEFLSSVPKGDLFGERFASSEASHIEQEAKIHQNYESSSRNTPNPQESFGVEANKIQGFARNAGLIQGNVGSKIDGVRAQYEGHRDGIGSKVLGGRVSVHNQSDVIEKQVNDKQNAGVVMSTAKHADNKFNISKGLQFLGEQVIANESDRPADDTEQGRVE